MFLVQKANLPHHLRSTTKKSSHVPKPNLLAAQFDEKIILHLKTLDLAPDSSNISLSWLSAAVSFLSTVHSETEVQISNLKSDPDDYYYYQDLYMDYSLKVLDLCNLISSAVNRLTERRLLINFSLRLLNLSGQTPSPEKLIKAKDTLARSGTGEAPGTEKDLRAKTLIDELTVLIGNLPRGRTSGGRDIIRRTFYAIGVLTVFVGSVLVTVLFGETDIIKLRVPAEFLFADLVNGVQDRIVDRIKVKENVILEVDDVARQAVVVSDLLQVVIAGGDDDGLRVCLEGGVKEMVIGAKRFSDGVDTLTNRVNGLFWTVLKIRNARLDV